MSATPSDHAAEAAADKTAAYTDFLFHHVQDSHAWELPFLHIPLPSFLSLHMLMLVLGSGFVLWLFLRAYRRQDSVPSGLTNFLELFVVFVRDEIVYETMGKKFGKPFVPYFCSLFFFILTLNVMGLIPLFATATGNYSVTGALAVVTFAMMIGGGIYYNGLKGFIHTFVPPGVPAPILVMLVPIEFLGLFIKPFVLAVRLFANMLAGHIVIFALIGMVLLLNAAAGIPAVIFAAALYFLEILVAFLQAYIFVLLSAMFVGSFVHPEH